MINVSIFKRNLICVSLRHHHLHHHHSPTFATLSSSYSQPPSSTAVTPPPTTSADENTLSSQTHQHPNLGSFNYVLANPKGDSLLGIARSTESNIEKIIFDFRFLALFAIGGLLAGSLLCFLNILQGCVYIFEAYKVYGTSCVKRDSHREYGFTILVEAIDVYLAGIVMLIFGMGLYGLFISNLNPDADDHISWLLQHGWHEKALAAVEAGQGRSQLLDEVGSRYLDHLIVERKYAEAASLCPKLLRGSATAWER
ncbi:hypothetical protein J1N35_038493 [Gossypium stocksii]|uniref:Uncharacterized protein n=1 Tax=Gossypium stocksii TaxID=47602 RepID=A0A9D3UMU6_9ROSI|nr:hypothetical protein J1N35_038493 [Gossypium stocksii]